MQSEFRFLNDAQLKAELAKCCGCETRPCRDACPVNCDPMEFIRAIKFVDLPHDFQVAAAHIMSLNPMGGTCGAVCPDKHCMSACVRKDIDGPVNIPAVQATIVHRARQMGVFPKFTSTKKIREQRVAVIGSGPSGLACAAILAQRGYDVHVFEKRRMAGGACNTIPEDRLPRHLLKGDIAFVESLENVHFTFGREISKPENLLEEGFHAVCVAVGLARHRMLGIPGEECATRAVEYLWDPSKYDLGKKVAIIGGGPVGVDVATTAKQRGVEDVFMFYRRTMAEMPLTEKERKTLFDYGINIVGRTLPTSIKVKGGKVCGLTTQRVSLPHRSTGSAKTIPVPNSEQHWDDIDSVVYSIGNEPALHVPANNPAIFGAGDVLFGSSTVVEAAAYGKNMANQIDRYLSGLVPEHIDRPVKSTWVLPGYSFTPVSLECDFFGYKLSSPFLLSASPLTDGYGPCKKAYDAGWPCVIMKTAFDGVPIHIPNHYMCKFSNNTYGNADNVSGHPLDRVCEELKRLRKEFPDRLTGASTGGPVTLDEEFDKRGWQSNTKKLEDAGAMIIEYSLSCPQGGDGSEGAIVSQNAELAAKIIDWVMQMSHPDIPKLFKLTGAVTSITPICRAIKNVFDKYPHKKAGITLANSFPGLYFRQGPHKKEWEEGIVMGLSGEGITPISNLTLASAANQGLVISGNGGPFDYMAACHFLALGCQTVQFCTLPTKHGVRVLEALVEGTSHMLAARGIKSIKDLIGRALPSSITDFMSLSPVKQISSVNPDLCIHCGLCTDCPYLAIELDENRIPKFDPSLCISCGVCTQKCPGDALSLRDRTQAERAVAPESSW